MLLTSFVNNTVLNIDRTIYKQITILLPLYKENIGSYLSAILAQYGIRNQQFIFKVLRLFLNYIEILEDIDYEVLVPSLDLDDSDDESLTEHFLNSPEFFEKINTNEIKIIEFDDTKPLCEFEIILPCFVLLKKNGQFFIYIKQLFSGALFKFFLNQRILKRKISSFVYLCWFYSTEYTDNYLSKQINKYCCIYRKRYYLNFLFLYKLMLYKNNNILDNFNVQDYYKKLRLSFYKK